MDKILDGKKTSQYLIEEIRQSYQKNKQERKPGLAVILVGNDAASQVYVGYKAQVCQQLGFNSWTINIPEESSKQQVIEKIKECNQDPNIDGILVQLPLPKHLESQEILENIKEDKDVDGFHAHNLGRLVQERQGVVPCTPWGIKYLLNHYQISLRSKHVVVVGRSIIVGKTMALLAVEKGTDATVTIVHSKTKHIRAITQQADILIVAIGQPQMVKQDWIKPGAVVIDVGIHRQAGKLVGDVDYHDVIDHVAAITPVPGGVGPMTVAGLMSNTWQAYQRHQQIR